MKESNRILIAGLIDLIVMIIAATPIILAAYWVTFHRNLKTGEIETFISPRIDDYIDIGIQYYMLVYVAWIVLRDVFNMSVGKRMQKVKITDRNTGLEASWIKKVIRNLPFIFFPPIEFAMKLIDPKARFGDMIANTKLKVITKHNNG